MRRVVCASPRSGGALQVGCGIYRGQESFQLLYSYKSDYKQLLPSRESSFQ